MRFDAMAMGADDGGGRFVSNVLGHVQWEKHGATPARGYYRAAREADKAERDLGGGP